MLRQESKADAYDIKYKESSTINQKQIVKSKEKKKHQVTCSSQESTKHDLNYRKKDGGWCKLKKYSENRTQLIYTMKIKVRRTDSDRSSDKFESNKARLQQKKRKEAAGNNQIEQR